MTCKYIQDMHVCDYRIWLPSPAMPWATDRGLASHAMNNRQWFHQQCHEQQTAASPAMPWATDSGLTSNAMNNRSGLTSNAMSYSGLTSNAMSYSGLTSNAMSYRQPPHQQCHEQMAASPAMLWTMDSGLTSNAMSYSGLTSNAMSYRQPPHQQCHEQMAASPAMLWTVDSGLTSNAVSYSGLTSNAMSYSGLTSNAMSYRQRPHQQCHELQTAASPVSFCGRLLPPHDAVAPSQGPQALVAAVAHQWSDAWMLHTQPISASFTTH